ncbi:MAG TPA: DUF4259 domain-containing protein [Polyangiaceae bacterium]|jgi:hypothetical protein|nr:DUF4259 domain-containing protein [Polyangiaceae bacterium]
MSARRAEAIARGIATFDDDGALAWLEGYAATGGLEALKSALAVAEEGYLERGTCVALLGAAEIVAGASTGPRPGLPSGALRAISRLTPAQVEPLRELAARQVHRVLGAHSELREYWDERDVEFPLWRASVLELCRRLERARRMVIE